MRHWFLSLFLFMSSAVWAQHVNMPSGQQPTQQQRTLIRAITMEGFVLENRSQFIKMFKPYRNHWLAKDDMDRLLGQVEKIYEQEGFKRLVNIVYKVHKHHLIFTASMTS